MIQLNGRKRSYPHNLIWYTESTDLGIQSFQSIPEDPEQQIHQRILEALLDHCHGGTTLMCSYYIFLFNPFPEI